MEPQVIDPALGTGAFLYYTPRWIVDLMGRELDRAVAEKVMGCYEKERTRFRRRTVYDLVIPGGTDAISFFAPGACWAAVPHYSTCPRDDYSVLVKVRTDWVYSQRAAFTEQLDLILRTRIPLTNGVEAYPNRLLRYEPGDYSKAALAAMGGGNAD